MKLASLRNGRDGSLVVVSKDATRAVDATHIAPTMQAVLDDWDDRSPKLEVLYEALNDGSEEESVDRDAVLSQQFIDEDAL